MTDGDSTTNGGETEATSPADEPSAQKPSSDPELDLTVVDDLDAADGEAGDIQGGSIGLSRKPV